MVAWRYTFDGGEEQPLDVETTLYMLAAMQAFARQRIVDLHSIGPGAGVKRYRGHVVKLWDDELVRDYPPTLYGICLDEFSDLKIVALGRTK